MNMNVNFFSSAASRRVIPLTLPVGATVRQAINASGEHPEGLPADCEVFINGEQAAPGRSVEEVMSTQIPAQAAGTLCNMTISRKTKGNEV